MTIIQRPGVMAFCATMPDYIIDTDSTITFAVQYKGKKILEEEYVPDGNYQVRIRQLGKFCAKALWGVWCDANTQLQADVAEAFSFLINGVVDTTTFVYFSRMKTRKEAHDAGWLSEIREKVTRVGIQEYASLLMASGEKVVVIARSENNGGSSQTLYTHAGDKSVVTLDVSLDRIAPLFHTGGSEIKSYQVVYGSHLLKFLVDHTQYPEIHCYRYKNVYDVPETVTTVGGLLVKGNNESDAAGMFGIERKFDVKVTDEYTGNSGTIFLQSDYKLWHNFLNAQEVEVWQDGWLPIVITKQTFERELNRTALKEVEFSFRMADPEQNNMFEV